jgi:hypothetical protein
MAEFPFYDLKMLLGRATIPKEAVRRQSDDFNRILLVDVDEY